VSLSQPPNACLPEAPLSPFELALASYLYEAMTAYGASLHRLRSCLGPKDDLDLSLADHRVALLRFLNEWGCRNLARDWHALALAEIERWYGDARERVDSLGRPRQALDTASRRDLVEVFDELSTRIIAHKESKGRQLHISFGPTATSKTLFALHPSLFPAWDRPIREKLGYSGDGESYAQFTTDLHEKIEESKRQARRDGFALEGLPEMLGRPGYTTLVQLFAEYYWITLTRGVSLRSREEISGWLSW
jgi:hypothetical protein